jgi:hypothetical protein
MGAVVVKGGLQKLLANEMQSNAAEYPATVHLFANDHTPGVNDTVADYTEVTAAGYAPVNLGPVGAIGWNSPAAYASWDNAVFVNSNPSSSPFTCYGYYVLDSAGQLAWAERDPVAPVAVAGGGGSYSVQINRELKNA